MALIPAPAISVYINFWPIGAALAIAPLGAVFAVGAKLQRDTDGMI